MEETPQMREPVRTPAEPTPETPAMETAPAEQAAQPETPQEAPKPGVTLSVTLNGETKTEAVRFHTPTLLETVKGLDDAAQVTLTAVDPGATELRTLLQGTKAEAVTALEKSIVPANMLMVELQKFTRFLLEHSSLKGVGVHAVCIADEKDAGFGFVSTAEDCTKAQAVELVNCGDANLDEFITKAQLDVPGRAGTPAKGTIVTPTPDQVEKLG